MFSPWEHNIDQVAAAMLSDSGWQRPPNDVTPTGGGLIANYLAPLASLPAMRPPSIFAGVPGVIRKGIDKVRTADREDRILGGVFAIWHEELTIAMVAALASVAMGAPRL